MHPLYLTTPSSGPDCLELHVHTRGLVGLPALKVHWHKPGVPCRSENKSMHATRGSSITLVPHDSLHVRVGLGAHIAALRPPLLGSEERRRQNTHRPFLAPHDDLCADAPHSIVGDVLRRPEARHVSCCRTALRVLLLRPDLADPKRVAAGRYDVAVLLVLAGNTLHQGESATLEVADLPAGCDVPHAQRIGGADDLCAVVAERYPGQHGRVSRQRALRIHDVLAGASAVAGARVPDG